MRNKLLTILLGLGILASCDENIIAQVPEAEVWKLGWSMVANSMEKNYEIAELQFDSLLNITNKIDRKYLVTGLEAKYKLGKMEQITKILNAQSKDMLCGRDGRGFFSQSALAANRKNQKEK